MKHAYVSRWWVLALPLLLSLTARAQQPWRPFRPGLIYSYALRNNTGVVHTVRVDSAYRTSAGDSVYTFNRLMRVYQGSGQISYAKSRNNLFGARMSWRPGQNAYVLESDAQSGVQAAISVLLYPYAAVGRTWVAATTPNVLTASIQTRGRVAILPGVQDSVVTIELRTGAATTGPPVMAFTLSRDHGLVEATPWLGGAAAGTAVSAPLLVAIPQTLAQSPYNPAALFAMQPGDELGYYSTPFNYFGPVVCTESYALRRVLTRQQRADSLVITYREQSQIRQTGYSPCGNQPGVTASPVSTGRMAFSMATGRSPQYPALGLLANEYVRDAAFASRQGQFMGLGVVANGGGECLSSGDQLRYTRLYGNPAGGPATTYSPGLDAFAWGQTFGNTPGMGDVQTDQTRTVYYRRGVGSPLVCGSFMNFATLLPSRVAQAAAVATLYPNPAVAAVTLVLAEPIGPGSILQLTDALGRTVWHAPVPAGQTSVAVPLAGRPGGLYLLHLNSGGSAATWKLNHE